MHQNYKTASVVASVCMVAAGILLSFSVRDPLSYLPKPHQVLAAGRSVDAGGLTGISLETRDQTKPVFLFEEPNGKRFSDAEIDNEIEAFVAAMALPAHAQWVNLDPGERERMIDARLAKTALGKTMLEQDYMLKQFVSSLTLPTTELGKKYWSGRAATDNSARKVWIVPQRAHVIFDGTRAFVSDARLAIRSEDPFFAQTARDIIEREINESERFVPLRRAYRAAILAEWYKKACAKTPMRDIFASGDLSGVSNVPVAFSHALFARYRASALGGVYRLRVPLEKNTYRMFASGGVAWEGLSHQVMVSYGDVNIDTLRAVRGSYTDRNGQTIGSSAIRHNRPSASKRWAARESDHDVERLYHQWRAQYGSSDEYFRAFSDWELSVPFLSFSDKVYTYAMLERYGLLKKPFNSNVAIRLLQDVRDDLPKDVYGLLSAQVRLSGGIQSIAAAHPARLSRAYMGKVMVRRDHGPVVELYGQPYLGDQTLGRLADTVFLQRYLLTAYEKGRSTKQQKLIDVALSDSLSAQERDLFDRLDRGALRIRGDSHMHVQTAASADFVWLFAVGGVDLADSLSPQFVRALYPSEGDKGADHTIDWNLYSGDSYVDLNDIVRHARAIRDDLITKLSLSRSIDDEALYRAAFDANARRLEDYFLFKHVYLEHIQMRPYAGEDFDMIKFWQTYDVATVLFRQAERKGVMTEEDYAACQGLWVRQIIAENHKNRYIELRFQPKYSDRAFEQAIDAMRKEIDAARVLYPKTHVSLVCAFSRYPGEKGFAKAMDRAQVFMDLLKRRRDLVPYFSGWDIQARSIGAPPQRYDELRDAFERFGKETGIVLAASNHLSEGWGIDGSYAIDNVTAMRYAEHEIADQRTQSVAHLTAVMMPFAGLAVERAVAVNESELQQTVAWVHELASAGVPIDVASLDARVKAALARTDPDVIDPIVMFDRPLLSPDEQHAVAVRIMRLLVSRKVFLELNPTMNVLSNAEMGTFDRYHLVRLAADGFRVDGEDFSALRDLIVIGTDVPTILGLHRGVKEEYVRLGQGMLSHGISVDAIVELLSNFDANTAKRRSEIAPLMQYVSSARQDHVETKNVTSTPVGGIDFGVLSGLVSEAVSAYRYAPAVEWSEVDGLRFAREKG